MISQSLSEDTKLLFEPFEKAYRKSSKCDAASSVIFSHNFIHASLKFTVIFCDLWMCCH